MPDSFSSSELDQLTAIKPVEVRIAAMDLLARREHSLEELRRKLKRRFANEDLVEGELQRLKDENLQSDERYADGFLRQRSARGYGPRRVRHEMRQKGLSDTEISNAFDRVEVDWFALAAAVMSKKFGDIPVLEIKEKARRIRFMQYRGFNSDHYQHLI